MTKFKIYDSPKPRYRHDQTGEINASKLNECHLQTNDSRSGFAQSTQAPVLSLLFNDDVDPQVSSESSIASKPTANDTIKTRKPEGDSLHKKILNLPKFHIAKLFKRSTCHFQNDGRLRFHTSPS